MASLIEARKPGSRDTWPVPMPFENAPTGTNVLNWKVNCDNSQSSIRVLVPRIKSPKPEVGQTGAGVVSAGRGSMWR